MIQHNIEYWLVAASILTGLQLWLSASDSAFRGLRNKSAAADETRMQTKVRLDH